MRGRRPPFCIGIEEEYHLVDRKTRDVVSDPPRDILSECAALLHEDQVHPELLRSQIEVETRVCRTVREAIEDLAGLRQTVAKVTEKYGLAPVAASTHPFAHWQSQRHTDKERYIALTRDMQAVARCMLVCGMHVHVGIDDDDLRIGLMNEFSQFLPVLLALSCSSPFWEGEDTGLKSFRLTVFDGFPRTGLPEHFGSFADYRHHVGIMEKAGLIEDATHIWWDLRPSARYPTLEMRITDVCTDLEDAGSIAALAISILSMLYRASREHPRWRVYPRLLIEENRWRAMRYGCDEGLLDFATGELAPCPDLVAGLVERVRADAEQLGCLNELERVLDIPERGTSAHRQLRVYEEAIRGGANHHQALQAVVDMLIEQTAGGL